MRKLLLLMIATVCCGNAMAQGDNLKIHFDFSNVSGTTVTDAASGIQAKLMNQAKVTKMGNYSVLDLGDGTGYLNMTSAAGQQVRSLEDFTVSAYYHVDEAASLSGAGHFLWSFSQSEANTQTSAPYMAYRLNAQRMATSTGGWSGETAVAVGSESAKGAWIHVLYRQKAQKGELFVGGKVVASSTAMPLLKNAFTANPAYNWIGRAPFANDSYLKQTLVADFRLYNVALADSDVAALAAETAKLEDAYLNGGGGDNSVLLSVLAEAESLLAGQDSYPAGAVQMLEDAVTVARGVSSCDLSQMRYDDCVAQLRQVMTAFKAAKDVVFDLSGITEVYNTERGFRHPGGLHTDADFERIRRQLAEGNAKVTEAYAKLKSAEYSQASVATYPVETIIRGGSSGQNYINAARGATMAYQNALRWKIEGNEANAKGAVRILMAWANTTKAVSGDSNWALAAGLYGYEFAQAAELMRDYEGWSSEDFEKFRQWMLTVWYPGNIRFMRDRNGTWDNPGGWGDCPGHYWSNWPLCNALAIISIGILCDDVFIYNQGLSFIKYDQVGTFVDPRTANPILNDGCTEFMGNLVVTTSEWDDETGAYGRVGQMQESGRDIGHATMALGLAVDICHVAWNQGDDLFSYMDNRMAAGIEFVAACVQGVSNLPWTPYKYADKGIAWWDSRSWLQNSYATGEQVRNYWGTVIGHYEGVKGVKMPYAEWAYDKMGIDVGGTGGTSGAYDHLGYSVLMNTYDEQLCPAEKRPTLLSPRMEYNGKTVDHNELGGLRNTYVVQSSACLPAGTVVKLMPQLPADAADTGNWKWNTGQTTRDITVTADRSYVYRVTYTNENGVESQQNFSLAVEGDCTPFDTRQQILVNGVAAGDSVATVFVGDKIELTASDAAGWYPEVCWDNGSRQATAYYGLAATDRVIRGYVVSQGGRKEPVSYHIYVKKMEPRIVRNGEVLKGQSTIVVGQGDDVTLQVYVPAAVGPVSYLWADGTTQSAVTVSSVENSFTLSVEVSYGGEKETVVFQVFVKEPSAAIVTEGDYMLKLAGIDGYLTANGKGNAVTFTPCPDSTSPAPSQQWHIMASGTRHSFLSLADSTGLGTAGTCNTSALRVFYFDKAAGMERYALRSGTGNNSKFWSVADDGSVVITQQATVTDFPFELIPIVTEGVSQPHAGPSALPEYYDLQGHRLKTLPQKGIVIMKTADKAAPYRKIIR